MLNGSAKVKLNLIDATQFVSTPNTGLHFIQGMAKRGPINKPDKIYNTWEAWVEDYGGLMLDNDTPKSVKVLLEGGSSVRFSRVVNYTDITDTTTTTAKQSKSSDILDGASNPMFSLTTKGFGSDYNDLIVNIAQASNGDTKSFDLTLTHKTDGTFVTETYTNIVLPTKTLLAGESDYLKDVVEKSSLVEVEYKDITVVPTTMAYDDYTFTGGSNGNTPEAKDYIGDSSTNTGLHAFDEYDDSMQLTTFGKYDDSINVAGSDYAFNRKDLVYYVWLGTGTKTELITKRDKVTSNPYVQFIGGEGITTNLLNNKEDKVNPLPDVLNAIANSDQENGPWYSYAGPKRGILRRFIKLTHNFGTKAKLGDLDELANRQINMVINRNGRTMLWGNFSGQTSNTQLQQISVLRLVIYMRKTLVPTLEEFIDEPNVTSTWLRVYHVVKPFLDTLVDKRALISYRWEGDQFISDPAQWKVNKAVEVQEGKYKIKLFITAISAIREIEIDLTLQDYTIEFNVDSVSA